MEGYIQAVNGGKTKRYVQMLEISDDPELVAEYRKWHSEEHHWKEIRDGIREVGILRRLQLAGGDGPSGYPTPPSRMGGLRGQVPGLQRRRPQR